LAAPARRLAARGGPALNPAVALFGTSADPPTVGHRAVLAGLLELYPLVCTWASNNPFKQHGAPLEVRAALLAAVVDELCLHHPPGQLQLRQELSSTRALESLAAAQRLFPAHQRVFVVGSDLVPQIPRWAAVKDWLPHCRLAVIPRRGWPLQAEELETLRSLGAQLEHLPLEIPEAASSTVRRHPNPELVPPALLPQLVQQNLYEFTTADLPPSADRPDPIQPPGG
jgi:nicotinate-nucleotide adenylyltransferase